MKCPVCHCRLSSTQEQAEAAPFCSERCRLVDLGRWLSEDYRIAGPPADRNSSAELGDDAEEEQGSDD